MTKISLTMGNGYKEMLRDRIPNTVDIALKWRKAKERWLEHVYRTEICVYPVKDKQNRYATTRMILGISKKDRIFDFHRSIDWDNISPMERTYWANIETWVNWFIRKYMYIKNTYDISLSCGKDENSIKEIIINEYLWQLSPHWRNKLANFLIKTFKN